MAKKTYQELAHIYLAKRYGTLSNDLRLAEKDAIMANNKATLIRSELDAVTDVMQAFEDELKQQK